MLGEDVGSGTNTRHPLTGTPLPNFNLRKASRNPYEL